MSALLWYFDKEADVLCCPRERRGDAADFEEVGEGVMARFDPSTREVVGFTILNFLKPTGKGVPAVVLPVRAELTLAT